MHFSDRAPMAASGAPKSQDFGRLLAAGEIVARGLSGGRRNRCRPMLGEGRGFATDLECVYLPWPLPAVEAAEVVTAAIALQCAPTKELLATLPLARLGHREALALQWVEGIAAMAWAGTQWPGLAEPLRSLSGGIEAGPVRDLQAQALLAEAFELVRSRQPFAVPALFGQLPIVRSAVVDMAARRSQMESRLPWSGEARLNRLTRWSVAVGGSADSDTAARRTGTPDLHEEARMVTRRKARVGIPYPEWNCVTQGYREDHVTVFETRVAATAMRRMEANPRLATWFEQPLERSWKRQLEDGMDVDPDALVDLCIDALTGTQSIPRVYRDRLPAARDVVTAVLIDRSGSLVQERNLQHELACANALVAAMLRAGERHAVYAFWSDTRHHVAVEVLRDFDDGHALVLDEARLRPRGYTRIGAAVRHASARLGRQAAGRRVLLVLGDAVPCDEGYEGLYAVADVVKAVEEAEENGIAVAFVAVGQPPEDDLALPLKGKFTRVHTVEDLAPILADVHARLVA